MAYTYTVKKGDTLNAIANQYGYGNYKQAGISSVPSGNFNLIREGEQIVLGNYNPNTVSTIGGGSPVVSSKDNANQFRTDSDRINLLDQAFKDTTLTGEKGMEEDKVKAAGATGGETGTTGDPKYDNIAKEEAAAKQKDMADAAQRKADYSALFTTSLAAVDATAKATIDNLNLTYDKRTREQERINQLNIDRVKAYGLANGGQYTPISFGDAISVREEEAADKISELDRQRNALLADARAARDRGASALLRQKLEDIDKIDSDLRTHLQEAEKEADAQYKLLRDLRKEEEAKHKEALQTSRDRLTDLAPRLVADYAEMTDDEQDKYIMKIASQSGLNYAEVYAAMERAAAEETEKEEAASEKKAKADKASADLESVKAGTKQKEADTAGAADLSAQRQASAAASYASANASNALAEQRRKAGTGGGGEEFTAAEKKKLEQAGISGAPRQQQLDYLFMDNLDYEEKYGESGATVAVISPDGEEGTIPADQLEQALKEGYKKK